MSQVHERDPVLVSIETPLRSEDGDLDLELLRYRLSLTPLERIEENDQFSGFLELVREAGTEDGRNR